jgi:hypothetical protein
VRLSAIGEPSKSQVGQERLGMLGKGGEARVVLQYVGKRLDKDELRPLVTLASRAVTAVCNSCGPWPWLPSRVHGNPVGSSRFSELQ